MKRSKFSEYVTSAAFRIELSAPMIRALLALGGGFDVYMDHMGSRCVSGAYGLVRRGLVEHKSGEGFYLTEAGKQLIVLLNLAGYKLETPAKAA